MDIAKLYGDIYPEMKALLAAGTLDVSGQFFIRDAGSGLVMVIGVAQMPVPPIETETIYVGKLTLDASTAEDVSEKVRGFGAEGILRAPLWRVAKG